jgi:hypothetical protein
MDALGYQRFAVAGHDTGMWIGYALAADHPDRSPGWPSPRPPCPACPPHRRCSQHRGQRPAVALRLQPARPGQRATRRRAGRHLLRVSVRQGREDPARLRCPALRRRPGRPRRPARQLRGLPRAGGHYREERAAQDPPAGPARPGHRRRRRHRGRGVEHDEARRR